VHKELKIAQALPGGPWSSITAPITGVVGKPVDS
jgi:hypothetical protein